MSLTFASFHADEIVTDPESVMVAVNHACRYREIPKMVQAVCEVGEVIHFILRHLASPGDAYAYRLVPLLDLSSDGFVATVAAHDQGSQDIVGVFSARETTFAVYREAGCRA